MGQIVKWFVVTAVVLICLQVLLRYVFRSASMWTYELPIQVAACMYALSWGYVLLEKGHARVDIIYGRFSDRVKAIIDSVCFVCLFLPVVGTLTYLSYNWMVRAYAISERTQFTYLYLPAQPLRTLIFVGILLFLIQGLAQFARDIYLAVKGKQL
jgi:TRAP-type mannitol/chloroaromatic compound transport system permease small subunit